MQMNIAEINAMNWRIIKGYTDEMRYRSMRGLELQSNYHYPYPYYDRLSLWSSEIALKESVRVEYLSPIMKHIYNGLIARIELEG